jgi:uncharacterized phage protein (TIGR01671 family)
MREIKFRAWDGKTKEFIECGPLYGLQAHIPKERRADSGYIITEFTGLHDKNGTEIYEGDLLRIWETHILEVRWGRVGWVLFGELFKRLGFEDGADCGEYHTKNYVRDMEVIGNIYENPEL